MSLRRVQVQYTVRISSSFAPQTLRICSIRLESPWRGHGIDRSMIKSQPVNDSARLRPPSVGFGGGV